MAAAIFLILIGGMAVIGAPLYVAFLAGSILFIILDPRISILACAQIVFGAVDSWAMLALPFFVLAGNLMTYGKISGYLVDLLERFVGSLRGGLGVVGVLTCTIFGALTGSGIATTTAVGTAIVPEMLKRGYSRRYSTGLIAASGTLGQIIPPSLMLILLGILCELSIVKLFIASLVPGIIISLFMCITAVLVAMRTERKVMRKEATERHNLGMLIIKACPALGMPVIILGGIYGGIFTATEAAAVACIYALLAMVIYKQISYANIKASILVTIKTTSTLYILIGTAVLFSHILTLLKIPQGLTSLVISLQLSPFGYIWVCLGIYLILGCFLDGAAIAVVSIPLVWDSAMALGFDPIHMAVFISAAIVAGQVTPPFGMSLFAMSSITEESVGTIAIGALPFFVAEAVGIALVGIFPLISLWLITIAY